MSHLEVAFRPIVLLATVPFLCLACDASGPVAAGARTPPVPAGAAPSVNGSGHSPHPTLGTDRNFTVHARGDGAGAAHGLVNLINQFDEVSSHSRVAVTCMEIDGNRARMGGTVLLDTDVPEIAGFDAFWVVEDNGEGGTAAPDRISRIFVSANPEVAEAFCDGSLGFSPALFDVERGSIQVRP